jgi:hypothetical protein
MLTLTALNECFEDAVDFGARYVAVKIAIGLSQEEVIINPRSNFDEKKTYYNHAYNESLRHKFSGDSDIRITSFTYGDSFMEIEEKLKEMAITGSSISLN